MPDITSAELNRLKQLGERIDRVSGDRDALRAERKQLKAEVAALKGRARELEKDLGKLKAAGDEATDTLEERVSALVVENREQAKLLRQAQRDTERLVTAAEKLRTSNEALKASEKELRAANRQLTQQVTRLDRESANLTNRLKAARLKLEGKGIPVELDASEVAEILDDFVGQLRLRSSGLVTQGSEIKLKVAFGARGFVVPTAGMASEDLPELHEIRLDLGRVAVTEVGDQE
jgi:chromosome segregation ATPase